MTVFADDIEHFTEARGWVDADRWRLHLAHQGVTFALPGGSAPLCPMSYSDAAAFADALGFLYEQFSNGGTRLYVGPRRVGLMRREKP